jgi:transposase InsO family protein
MIAFIHDHLGAHGVEPICKVLPIAPSTYHAHVAKRRDPARLSARARQDVRLKIEVRRVFDENFRVYGVRKVWRQLKREGFDVARCTVARLMRDMGLQGVIRGKPVKTTISDKAAPCPLDRQSPVQGTKAERSLALRLHLCRDLERLCLCRLRHRRLCPQDRWLAGLAHGARRLRARCAGAGPARSPTGPSRRPRAP